MKPCPADSSDVLVLVVSYRNNEQLVRFTERMQMVAPKWLTVVAVANGLSPDSQRELVSAMRVYGLRAPHLLFPETNLGYFGGALYGYKEYCRQFPEPRWVIVTNDDVYFAEDFFDQLAALDIPSQTGCIAPDIVVAGSHCHQNPFATNRPSRLKMEMSRIFYGHAWLFRLFLALRCVRQLLRGGRRKPVPPRSELIYAPHGACILFTAEYFRSGGTLAHHSFLYAEENFVAETCLTLGLGVRFEPSLCVEHDEHSSMIKVPPALHLSYLHDATCALIKEYYS